MYENNLLIKGGILYYNTDGCSKKFRCANSVWLSSVLIFTYRVIIDRCINAPGHGEIKIDVINVSDKDIL